MLRSPRIALFVSYFVFLEFFFLYIWFGCFWYLCYGKWREIPISAHKREFYMRKTIHIYTTRTQSLNSVNGVLQLAHKWQIFLRAQTRDNVSARTVQLVSLMCVIFGSQRFSYVMCEYTQRMPLTHTNTHETYGNMEKCCWHTRPKTWWHLIFLFIVFFFSFGDCFVVQRWVEDHVTCRFNSKSITSS